MFDINQFNDRHAALFGLIDACLLHANESVMSLVDRVLWARLAVQYYDELLQVDAAIFRHSVETKGADCK